VFAHDDWLETRIAYGWVGFALIIANLLVLCAWIFIVWKPASHRSFAVSAGTGLIGALVHAKFDFPFQTYSIFFTFVIIAGILTSPARAYRRTSESH
jgi:hypothetical protein